MIRHVNGSGASDAHVSPDAEIADGTRLGHFAVIHAGVVIGPGCVIEDHVVLGKTPKLGASSTAASGEPLPQLVLGAGVTVCAGAVVFAGATIGDHVILGDQSYVRERSRIGAGTRIGRGSCIDNDVVIGKRCSIQTSVYITGGSVIEDDVFVGPCAMTTNDNTMGRREPTGPPMLGATLRRACRIGGGAVIAPGVEIGEEAFVAAGAVVTRHLGARAVAMGVPARVVREVGDEDLLQRWR
jgi:acetyltransferase-like isoleucine patch superfamily enzyme